MPSAGNHISAIINFFSFSSLLIGCSALSRASHENQLPICTKNLRVEKANSTLSRAFKFSKANRASWMTNFWSWTVSGKEKWKFCLQHNKLIASLKCKWTLAFKSTRRRRNWFQWCKLARISFARASLSATWNVTHRLSPENHFLQRTLFLLFLSIDATVWSTLEFVGKHPKVNFSP